MALQPRAAGAWETVGRLGPMPVASGCGHSKLKRPQPCAAVRRDPGAPSRQQLRFIPARMRFREFWYGCSRVQIVAVGPASKSRARCPAARRSLIQVEGRTGLWASWGCAVGAARLRRQRSV